MQREMFPRLRRGFGTEDCRVLRLRANGARFLYKPPNASLEEAREGVKSLEKIGRTIERVLTGCTDPGQLPLLAPLLPYVRTELLAEARAKVAQLSARRRRETPPDELDELEEAD